jgi:hypothetical protein
MLVILIIHFQYFTGCGIVLPGNNSYGFLVCTEILFAGKDPFIPLEINLDYNIEG